MVKIKLCGFTRREDIQKAVELGADYIGIILYPKSPRCVSWERAKELVELSGSVKSVAVMVNPSHQEAERAIQIGFDLLQLHGEEDFYLVESLGPEKIIKGFRTCPGQKPSQEWKRVYGLLLDACSNLYGGSGQKSDWEMAKSLATTGFRVFLAGGLKPENVAEAIRKVEPYAVDASSGIESSPGIKDHKKMEDFINAVKNASGDGQQP
ncbi:MAG: phosphoribosylanthranilate isomerase [Aquificaceae bacterium]|nr:phosphoribosylanthranilate isomerase [Aquificaceae bacterium]